MLKPGGSLFVIWQPHWAKTDAQVKESVQKTSEQLNQAGFELTELKFKSLKPVTGGASQFCKKARERGVYSRLKLANKGGYADVALTADFLGFQRLQPGLAIA